MRSQAYVFQHKVFMDADAQKRFKIFKRKTKNMEVNVRIAKCIYAYAELVYIYIHIQVDIGFCLHSHKYIF